MAASGRTDPRAFAGRLSLYWPLRDFLPVPEMWTTRLSLVDDGGLLQDARVMTREAMISGLLDDRLLAQASYFHLPASEISGHAWDVVSLMGLPHSAAGTIDPPNLNTDGFVTVDHREATSAPPTKGPSRDPLDDDTSAAEISGLTHVTVVCATAALPTSSEPDAVVRAVHEIEELVHTTARALHAVTGMGYALPTLASAKLEVLIGLDTVVDGALKAAWNVGHYSAGGLTFAVRDKVDETLSEALAFAELDCSQHSPRSLVLDLQRQAVAAGRRQGDPRTAVVMAAATCEAWVDLMIGALLWEDGASPEDAAAQMLRYRDNKERLMRLLAPRLRGPWDIERDPALLAWNQDVRLARNRVLHAGGLPGAGLSERSINAMYGFLSLTLDRLCDPQVRNQYPLTAVLLANRVGLEARNGWTRRIQQAATDADRDDLNGAFNRWYSVTSQLLLPEPMRPTPRQTELQMVALGDGRTYFIERDPTAAIARLVTLSPSDENSLQAYRPATDSGLTASFDVQFSHEPAGEWLPEHNLVPGAAVMRDPSTWYSPPAAPRA